ncbi:Na+/H+ antiporter subunit E [Magnetofaba australis]|nr:Na+/H+ antiporter subunit E [Magnetofaba australis]
MDANRAVFASAITLFLFWLLLSGSLAWDVLLIGALASALIARLMPASLSPLTEFRATPGGVIAAVTFLFVFLWELVKANLRLARIVLTPSLPIAPGFVKVRTKLTSRMGRLLLANAITLTPGTLTVELDGEWLFIHWVTAQADDVEAATAAIVTGFEKHLEAMYG